MNYRQKVKQDWKANGKTISKPGFQVLLIYHFGNWRMGIKSRILRFPLSLLYKMLYRRMCVKFGIELPYSVKLGCRTVIEHQNGIVVHGNAVLGDDCIIRQGVTIGNRYMDRPQDAPVIGNRVNIGAGAMILGKVHIGDDVNIGANAVIIEDIPSGKTAVALKARIL